MNQVQAGRQGEMDGVPGRMSFIPGLRPEAATLVLHSQVLAARAISKIQPETLHRSSNPISSALNNKGETGWEEDLRPNKA